jgi:hypothetical protein
MTSVKYAWQKLIRVVSQKLQQHGHKKISYPTAYSPKNFPNLGQ